MTIRTCPGDAAPQARAVGQTDRMRVYLPATLDDVGDLAGVAAGPAHAVTAALRAALPDDDEESLEYAAQLAAADDCLALLAERPGAPRLRVVLAAEVPDGQVAPSQDPRGPSSVELQWAVDRSDIICALVDEPAARRDVETALAGDAAAADRLWERELLWYDASELCSIPR